MQSATKKIRSRQTLISNFIHHRKSYALSISDTQLSEVWLRESVQDSPTQSSLPFAQSEHWQYAEHSRPDFTHTHRLFLHPQHICKHPVSLRNWELGPSGRQLGEAVLQESVFPSHRMWDLVRYHANSGPDEIPGGSGGSMLLLLEGE